MLQSLCWKPSRDTRSISSWEKQHHSRTAKQANWAGCVRGCATMNNPPILSVWIQACPLLRVFPPPVVLLRCRPSTISSICVLVDSDHLKKEVIISKRRNMFWRWNWRCLVLQEMKSLDKLSTFKAWNVSSKNSAVLFNNCNSSNWTKQSKPIQSTSTRPKYFTQ